jgi:outer membrane protein assembly complex protein YaeT
MYLRRIDISGLLLLLVLVFVFNAGRSFAFPDENSLFKVRKIRFNGVEKVSSSDLAESLAVQVPPFWEFWKPYPEIRINDLEDDKLRIQQYYQSQGFYQTTAEYEIIPVHPHISDSQADDSVPPVPVKEKSDASQKDRLPEYDLIFKIKEGPPVIIRDISINCQCELEGISDDEIIKTLALKSGKIFKTEAYDQSKILIRKLMGNRGYPFTKVRGSATVDLNDNSVKIAFDVDPGKLYNFGDIHITGHEDFVREDVLQRAMTFKCGERFATKKIDESRQNLFDLNIFKSAVVKMGDPEPEKDTVPVDIQVQPRKNRNVKFGVGYGTDDGLRLQAAWGYRNLTGRADNLTLRARRSDIVKNIFAEYRLPYFLSAQNNLVATAGYEREENDYYTLKQASTEVSFYHKLEANWFSSVGYILENNQPEDVTVEDAEGSVDPRDTESYLVSSVKFSVEHNTVDDILNPEKGSVVRFTYENASKYLGSGINYIRPGIETKIYIPIFWDMVLAGRMDFATIQKSENTDYIPISKQFFLGGSKSVRGYGFEKLGVINQNDVIEDVSGLSAFVSNIELRFPIYKEFGGVVFLDSGALNEDSFSVNFRSLRYTCGAGMRYKTIIGPIQIDYGYQLNPAKSTANDDSDLIDLLNNDRWSLSFSIGQAF